MKRNIYIKRILLSVALTLALIFGSFSVCFSQDQKIEFKASWKKTSSKNLISISLKKGSLPVNCYIYDSSPFTGGQLINKIEMVNTRKFTVEMVEKAKVYICIYKDEDNMSAKWLQNSK